MAKKESLAERLIRVSEEKVKIECENQKLREDCVAWQKAYNDKDNSFKLMFEAWDKVDTEKTELREKNSNLRAWQHLTELLFERCGTFIVKYSRELGVNDYLIKELGLDIYIVNEPKEDIIKKENQNNEDILSLFKQSSNSI